MHAIPKTARPDRPTLTIELVPAGQKSQTLDLLLPPRKWEDLRSLCHRRAGHICEICGDHPVECHEVWEYCDSTLVQRLVGVVALCAECHRVKHMGQAFASGENLRAIRHLMRVNGWKMQVADQHIAKAFTLWAQRSQKAWTLDLSWLKEKEPGSAARSLSA
jgi:hypothetical protein